MNIDDYAALAVVAGTITAILALAWQMQASRRAEDAARKAFLRESQERRRAEEAERFLQAFRLLDGGTQSRSSGIALLEGMEISSRWRGAISALLANQAIYLLERSGQGNRIDEIRNLDRILRLLTRPVPTDENPDRRLGTTDDLNAVKEALIRRQSDERTTVEYSKRSVVYGPGGLDLSQPHRSEANASQTRFEQPPNDEYAVSKLDAWLRLLD